MWLASWGGRGDNLSLTGKSKSQSCSCDFAHGNPLETKNTGFPPTTYLKITATSTVTNTSNNTIVGQLASLALGLENEKTPTARLSTLFVLW